jgi:hypothetical protein
MGRGVVGSELRGSLGIEPLCTFCTLISLFMFSSVFSTFSRLAAESRWTQDRIRKITDRKNRTGSD